MPDPNQSPALIAVAAVGGLVVIIFALRSVVAARASTDGPLQPLNSVPQFNDHNLTRQFIASIPNVTRQLVLEVATAQQTETFERADHWKLLWGWFDCGTNVASIQVPVTYRYHIGLEGDWKITLRGGTLFVIAPEIRASLPPAFDTHRVVNRTMRGRLRTNPQAMLEELQRGITPTLCAYANDPRRIDLVREAARLSVAEFVQKCLAGTMHKYARIEVRFANERQPRRAKPLLRYAKRYLALMNLLASVQQRDIALVPTAWTEQEKTRLYQALRKEEKEGIVFKQISERYAAGRPNSGGAQLKYKFYATASCIVAGTNKAKRSVRIVLFDPVQQREAGNVTIPPNHTMPSMGNVVEVRYLYAFRESGALYQPTYLGVRSDVPATDCTTQQLKYKAGEHDDQ